MTLQSSPKPPQPSAMPSAAERGRRFATRWRLGDFALAALLCFPSFFKTAGEQSSLASGLLLIALAMALLAAGLGRRVQASVGGSLNLVLSGWAMAALGATVGLLVVAESLSEPTRALASVVNLGLMFALALRLSAILASLSLQDIERQVDAALWVLLVNALLALTGLQLFENQSPEKPTGVFSEPSHLALALVFPLLYKAMRQGRQGVAWIGVWLMWGLWIENLTALCLITLCIVCWARRPLQMIALLATAATALSLADTEYFSSRLVLTDQTTNLSALVWLSGWETAHYIIHNVSVWGIGFQQLGFVSIQSDSVELIELLGAFGLNATDGGTTAAKLISEFGVPALLVLAGYGLFFFWAVGRLMFDGLDARRADVRFSLRRAAAVAPFMELFVRGLGYFSPTLFVCGVIAASLAFEKRAKT